MTIPQADTMVTRRHAMPFGTEVLPSGAVTFRVWAPKVNEMELYLEDNQQYYPMERDKQGTFSVTTDAAQAGSRYKLRMDSHELLVPDPASRFQPQDVHGPSEVIDPAGFLWQDGNWAGRPWEEAVIYELHVGTFTPEGTFTAAKDRLDDLVDLGITAIELLPLADFPGKRNWGYDGVLPYAPDSVYGRPEDLKDLVQTAHSKGLMVFLDVVYNHFGPEGNYIWIYGQQYFSRKHKTPWGKAINFDGKESRGVRDYFIHNTLYWLEEYHFDGLRFDAVHAIKDDSTPDILEELATAVNQGPGASRPIHLILENDDNEAHYLRCNANGVRDCYQAQWNDDIHHAMHVILTGEQDGYYSDYAQNPVDDLGRSLTEGFVYQGQPSPFRGGRQRGEPSAGLPLSHFVSFIQNHDQVGNRAFGERLAALASPRQLRAITSIYLLSPQTPMLFMGEEWGTTRPFLFFCDFEPDLAKAVRKGRRQEFAQFQKFQDPAIRKKIPDPGLPETFQQSRLDWGERTRSPHREWLTYYRDLLHCRKNHLVPRFRGSLKFESKRYTLMGDSALEVIWTWPDRTTLVLLANFGPQAVSVSLPEGRLLFESEPDTFSQAGKGHLPPETALWLLNDPKES